MIIYKPITGDDMIDKNTVENDLKTICSQTNSIYFTYDELHTYNPETNSVFDTAKLINALEPHLGSQTEYLLAKRGILLPQKGGKQYIQTNSAGGGGVNHGRLGSQNLNLFFFMNINSQSNQYTAYHEAAHSLQRTQNLFAANTMDKIYSFCSKGTKKANDSKLTEKFADKASYSSYLKEMHSEAFASACMMLRADSSSAFVKQAGLAFASGLNSTINAMHDNTQEYPGMRYYASQPIQSALSANFIARRLSGKTSEFYDKDNQLDFLALSKYVEKIVIKHAYSPQTFASILNNDILGRPSKKPADWWRMQGLLAFATLSITKPLSLFEEAKISSMMAVHRAENKKRVPYVFSPLEENDNYAKAINSLCKISDCQSEIINFCADKRIKPKKTIHALSLQMGINNDYEISHSVIAQLKRKLKKDKKLGYQEGQELYSLLTNYMQTANKEMLNNKDNPIFHNMADIIDSSSGTKLLWLFKDEKKYKPTAQNQYLSSPLERDDDNTLRHNFLQSIKASHNPLSSLENFSEIQAVVMEQFVHNPKKLANKENMAKLKELFAPKKKRLSLNLKHRKFSNNLASYLHDVQVLHYTYQKYEEFHSILDYAAKNPIEKLEKEINSRNSGEAQKLLPQSAAKDASAHISKMRECILSGKKSAAPDTKSVATSHIFSPKNQSRYER